MQIKQDYRSPQFEIPDCPNFPDFELTSVNDIFNDSSGKNQPILKATTYEPCENPFLDNHTNFLSPSLGDYLPYSQVYHLAWAGEKEGVGRTFCILRHYLNINSLSEEEKRSIKVAACIQDTMDTTENKFVTITKKEVTEERKQSVTYSENKQEKKTSDQSLLNQMSQIVAGATETSGDGFQAGGVVITIHKATNIEKKGLVGKADPNV